MLPGRAYPYNTILQTMYFPINILIILLIPTLALFPSQVSAAPVVEIEKHYYSVQGNTTNEIRSSLNTNSPVIVENTRFDAYTRWYITWKIRYSNTTTGCTISKITTHIDISHTLPQLTTDLPITIKSKWQQYYDALLAHEKGHADIGLQAATEIESTISNLPPQKHCATIEKMADNLSKGVIKKYISLERQYDRETEYGVATGAIFPQ